MQFKVEGEAVKNSLKVGGPVYASPCCGEFAFLRVGGVSYSFPFQGSGLAERTGGAGPVRVTITADPSLDWKEYNGHKYALTKTPGNWNNAEAQAESNGGHLVTINNAAENSWLLQTFGTGSLWIGLYQPAGSAEPAGGWTWISGEASSYRNWANTQPDNFTRADNYGMLLTGASGQWHDVPLEGWPRTSNFHGIVEIH